MRRKDVYRLSKREEKGIYSVVKTYLRRIDLL